MDTDYLFSIQIYTTLGRTLTLGNEKNSFSRTMTESPHVGGKYVGGWHVHDDEGNRVVGGPRIGGFRIEYDRGMLVELEAFVEGR